MDIDPALVAVAGALSTVAVTLFRQLLQRAERAETEAKEWEARYFRQIGMTDLAIDEAERRDR